MKRIKELTAMALAFAVAAVLVACGGNGGGSASSSGSGESASASASSAASAELYGSPWTTSVVQGNLPAEQPEAIQKAGLGELQPYLDRIDAVKSIDEMNALLTADDFPFSPFVLTNITLADTRDVNIVAVSANLALVDTVSVGGTYYQDTNDPQMQQTMEAAVQNMATMPLVDLMSAGMSQAEVQEAFATVLAFEKAHGKYVDYNGKYSMQDFGAAAEAVRDSYFTLDELCAACPNFPMKATLDKLGKGGSPKYASTREWLEASLPNLLLDTHPLNNLRVNVNAQMFDPIYDALGVAEGDAMYLAPNERINIWGPNA